MTVPNLLTAPDPIGPQPPTKDDVNRATQHTAAVNTPAPASDVDRARVAWATAGRDTEMARWQELYDLAVPRPQSETYRGCTEQELEPGS
jgi:hypothetical protein